MDTLDKLSRLVEALNSKKDADKTAIFKKIVNIFVSTTSWSAVAKELSTLNKKEVTADKFKLTEDEFSDLKKKTNKAKDSNFAVSVFQKSISKQLSLMLVELENSDKVNRFEDVVLPLLVLAVGLPLKYHTENDPFGKQLNYGANDSFKKEKTFIYAPHNYKALSLSHLPSNAIIRPIIIPILQFIIKCDGYITLNRLHDIPFIVQCLRFAVHFEDSELEILRSSFWELAIKVIKSVDFDMTNETTAIFDQLNALIWNDNGEDCTKAVWRSSNPSEGKSLIMSREEVCAYIALLRGMHRRVLVNIHLKSCLRDVIKNLMKSISYRKSSQDCMDLLNLLKGWIKKGKESPFDVSLVRMMIRDVLEAYDSYLAKSPNESMELTTKSLLSLGQETLAVINNLKSVKSSLESIFDRVNSTISKSAKDTKDTRDLLSEYVRFFTESIDFCDDSVETKDIPWFVLFRAVFVRCFVVKMKMEWMEKINVINPLYKIISGVLSTIVEELKDNTPCDYMNECIPILTEVVYLLINSKMDNGKKWKCIMSLSDSQIPSTIIKSISMMKNQSAKTQCSSFISKMIEPLTEIINEHPPKTTLSQFESFFIVALTVDISTEIRESVCSLWKKWYSSRMDELSGASITDELMGRLKWFNLPIPSNTINAKFEVKLEGGSPKKSVFSSSLKKGSIFSSPAPIKKAKNANDALKIIDLMDEDSVQFYPVESPKKKQRMTEKQKEMMMEKKDRLPFMEDESTTGIQKIPSDIFEMSLSCADGSKSTGSKKEQMKTDFSDLIGEKKSDKKEEGKELKNKDIEMENVEVKKEIVPKKITDDNIEESASSSCDSMNEEEEKKGSRRKTKNPVKMNIKTREERSPSRKKLEAALSMNSPRTNSPRRKSRRLGKIEENEKKDDEKMKKENGKNEEKEDKEKESHKTDKKDKEETSEKNEEEEKKTEDNKSREDMKEFDEDGSVVVLNEKEGILNNEKKNSLTPKREEKIVITSPDSALICFDDSIPIVQSIGEDSSPIKSMEGEMAVPSTPANRGSFEPVGILSSSKRKRSEKKKGGVHFDLTDEVKIEMIEEEGEKKEDRGIEDITEKMVFAPLRDNEDSIDSIILKLGLNSRMIKKSLEMIGVKTVGQLASLTSKEINGIMGIKPPKMLTVQKELKILLSRSEKPSSQPLPPICTPEKKKENRVVSPEKKKVNTLVTPEKKRESTIVSSNMDTSLPLHDLSPVTSYTSPPKSKSRKRLALSDSPIRVKKMKEDEDEKKEENPKELMENEMIEEKKEEVDDIVNEKLIEVSLEKSDLIEKKDEKVHEVMEMNEDKENKENKENDKKNEVEKEKEIEMTKPSITSVQDVVSFISSLKEGSLQSFLEAHEQITLSLMDALRDVRLSYYLND
ncbi:hypothetical protein PRIPAC_81146 [Pristionchus pacificus]|uniref:Uncharacterized protein n=1 Tax=Pristionchus pacificus TaxID=54126 RepID=A0A2A6BDW4_PRIPA|nr:hypothetical protein PRIPAC_81146 [Pristionchus pacificus]|eukprot:PDM64095.1 hypothetical protein PRIPAC_54339 [Pristionchus pacificus]